MTGHDVGPLEDWRTSFESAQGRRAVILARDPLASDGTDLLDCDIDLLCLGELFVEHHAELAGFAARGAGAAAAATLCQSEPDGSVELLEAHAQPRVLPVGPARLSPAGWRDGLMLACVARDSDARAVLAAPDHVAAAQFPADRQDAFWLPYCMAFASLVTGNRDFEGYAREARSLMRDSSIIDPDVLAHLDEPLLELAAALHSGDQARWSHQLRQALSAHQEYYAAEDHRFERRGFVSVGILGLCTLACMHGLDAPISSPYVPADLVCNVPQADLSRVVFRFGARRLLHDTEANWFLDLAGFSRAARRHRVGEIHGRLVARYEADGAPSLPHARADFVLSDDIPADDVPLALDAGQLVWLARRFAITAGEAWRSAPERRAALVEAIGCVEAALDRIPPGTDAIPAESFHTRLGRAEYELDAGHFRRDRLLAYRDALAAQLS